MRCYYYGFVELTRVSGPQAQVAQTEQVARMLSRMAREYLPQAAKLDGGKVPDIGPACLKRSSVGSPHKPVSLVASRSWPPGANTHGFIYRCPNTGLEVQGWVADDSTEWDDGSYKAVTCLVCARIHLVNPKTGNVLGEDDDE